MTELNRWCILVTGGAGFLGSKLVQALAGRGASVVAVDKAFRDNNDFCASSHGHTELLQASLPNDFVKLAQAMKRNDADRFAFYHMAGLSHVGRCEREPQLAFDLNVALTMRALQFCGEYGIEHFFFPSTGLIYGDTLTRPAVESDPTSANNIYTATKMAAEALILGFCEGRDLGGTVVRLSNVYGPGSSKETVIGGILSQLQGGGIIEVGSLAPVRDFIHADDVVAGLLRLLSSARSIDRRVLNLSTGVGISIGELAETALRAADMPHLQIRETGSVSSNRSNLVLDNTLIQTVTGWQPEHDLQSGLSAIIKETAFYEPVS